MKVELDIPDSTLSALRQAPVEFAACIRLMAAAKLYETGNLSQERAAELAGRSRQDFVLQLSHLGVTPFQGFEEDAAWISSLPF
jgi:predicted HTH domain antitoxin